MINVFAVGFNGGFFFSHCKKFNVEICVKLGKIIMPITIKILRLKRKIFTI